MIQAVNLTKSFFDHRRGWTTAVSDVSFDCQPGAVTGLLGPNGAGKTTTMRMLVTILKPTSGTAKIAGRDIIAEPDAARASFGYMSPSTQLYDRMTPWELVHFFGSLYGMEGPQLDERANQIFDWLGINDFRDKLISKLSAGMRQQAAIARAIIHDPPVLILDEPTSNLDVMAARTVLRKIRELRDQGKTIIFSTHSMRAVERICDQVVVIHGGRILAIGPIDELLERHSQSSVEELLFCLIDLANGDAA